MNIHYNIIFLFFWIDDTAEIIYVQTDGNRVLRFDVNGNPLNIINLPDSFPRLTTVSQNYNRK